MPVEQNCIGAGWENLLVALDPDLLYVLMLPISFHGKVEQYVGRMHREHEGKTEVRIYDYVDSEHRMLRAMYKRRASKYRKIGYEILA